MTIEEEKEKEKRASTRVSPFLASSFACLPADGLIGVGPDSLQASAMALLDDQRQRDVGSG